MSQFIEMFENVESYCKLEDLVSDTFPGEWGSEPISENAIKVIRTTNFTNEGYLDLTDVVTRDIEPKKVVRKKLKQGDTILERSGGTKDNPVGRVVFFDEIGDYLPNNFTQVLRPKESVNPVYLFYALYNSYNLNKAAMRAMASQTTGIQNLSMSDFMAKFIVLPSRNEQNKFEQIYRQADKSKFGDFKSQFIEMFKGDNQVPLGDICNIEKGATITRNDVLPGEVPVVAGGQEPSCYHNVANREAGAITVSASGAYAGYINFWNCPIFASDCNTIISKDDEKTDQTFVYFGLRAMQKQIYGLQKGGAQPHVYGKDLQKFMFPCPSYAKQIEFSKMAKQADKSKSVIQKALVYLNDIQSDELGKIA